MKYLPNIAGGLLGALFILFSSMVLFKLVPMPPPPPADTLPGMFMGAFGGSGYLIFVKVLELIGGILVAIPLTRNFGLLILGPIIVNILAFHVFISKDVFSKESLPVLSIIVVLSLYLLWSARAKFLALRN